MIKLQIIGNLGKDAEVREVNGKKVINFSVCHTQKNKEGVESSVWVSAAKWGDTTAIAPYLTKGTKVYCEGIPSVQVYGDPAKGELKLMVDKIELLGGGGGRTEQPAATQEDKREPAPRYEVDENSLPF